VIRRVHQFSPTVSFGDAVSNQIQSLERLLEELGHKGEVWVEQLPDHYAGRVRPMAEYAQQASEDDLLLAHFGLVYSRAVVGWLRSIPGRKVLVYHNITPSQYFAGINRVASESARGGREQLDVLCEIVDAGWGDSAYNARELTERGWTRVGVLPIVFEPRRYAVRPDQRVLGRYRDGLNVLYCGRIAPHKRIEDLVLVFYALNRRVQPDSRLLLVGSTRGMAAYADYLRDLVAELGLTEVVFAGHVSTAELVAYYQRAQAYLSMSEHEGFGVPLIESMHFGVPIVAFDSAAVPETLGGAGMMIKRRDYGSIAELIALLAEHEDLRSRIVARQRERLQAFSPGRVQERLRLLLGEL
jgi:glycosyltransferase involved in cell wall biosynthesis